MALRAGLFLLFTLLATNPVYADSSSPKLAAYYDRQMAIVDGKTYGWQGTETPRLISVDAVQVGVGRRRSYALTSKGTLFVYGTNLTRRTKLMDGIARFAAGESGVMAIAKNGSLWWMRPSGKGRRRLATNVSTAAVGDGANYYITTSSDLFVRGKAHRGQYGDGRLKPTTHFVRTATSVAQISAHTGHAISLLKNGDVMGTGGNIYGPVGKHGLGDKAVRWSKILSKASAIATGSSHSLAIRKDGTLMAWGSGYGPKPVQIMRNVISVAAGSRTTIVLKSDNSLWQWIGSQKPRRVLPKNK